MFQEVLVSSDSQQGHFESTSTSSNESTPNVKEQDVASQNAMSSFEGVQNSMVAASQKHSTIRLQLGLLSVDWDEVKDNPFTSVGLIASIMAAGYVTQNYWYRPIINYLNKKNSTSMQQGKDSKKDDKGLAEFTQSKARIYKPGDIKTRLKDVAGLEAAKLDVFDIMQFLKNPKIYADMGAQVPKGVLLQGPPGNGKTLLAKAIAGEVECPFISVCASEFIEMFVGAGAARVRDLFAKAKELSPCIIFFDEFDAIAKKRSSNSFGGGDEQAQTLGQLLTLMDGFDMQKYPIIVLAATNRAEVLDPAVLRPGRFDRLVEVGMPFLKDRIDILKVHLNNVKTSDHINVPLIARTTRGFSGAELAHLVNEAAILAVNDASSCVGMNHIDQAYDNITLGRETKGMDTAESEMWETAIHEAGHSVLRVFLEDADPLYKVTITPRGKALGISYSLPLKEKYSFKEVEMKAQIVVGLAGGLAEQEFGFGKATGLSNDLVKCRSIAYNMVTKYGMSDEFKYISYDEIDHKLSNDIATRIDEEVKKIVYECYDKSQAMVSEHREHIKKLAEMLMDEGTISGDVVYRMCGVPEPKIEYGLNK